MIVQTFGDYGIERQLNVLTWIRKQDENFLWIVTSAPEDRSS